VAQTMTPEPAAATGLAQSKSLPTRIVGVLFAPRTTYADVAAHPRVLGIFLTVFLVSATAATTFMSTEIGRTAVVDQQIAQSEAYGRHLNQTQIDAIEKMSAYYVYFAPVIQLVSFAIGGLLIASIAFAVFNALLGGDATFKQVFAVVAHSGVVLTALALFTTPLAYIRESLSSSTNLAVFLPFLDESSFAARLLGSIDLIYIWWMLSLAIGLGVLYRKRTGPIATTLLVLYVAIGLIIAAIKTATSGA
jgi:hypothetical protein